MPSVMEEQRACPRCELKYRPGDFRGGVCGWCADDLERIHNPKEEHGQGAG